MKRFVKQLDGLLRGEQAGAAASGIALPSLLQMTLLLGSTYGFFMGWYAVALHWGDGSAVGWLQLLSSSFKLPLLFLATLAVTFPSLYVFSALAGVPLDLRATLQLLLAAIVVTLTVAASLGPIVAFFTLSTTSYPFMVVLNVVLLGIAGSIGLTFMRRMLARVSSEPMLAAGAIVPDDDSSQGPPPTKVAAAKVADGPRPATMIFRIWIALFGLIGAQMGWLMRPFIGHPMAEFTWFRARESHFFLGLLENLGRMFGP